MGIKIKTSSLLILLVALCLAMFSQPAAQRQYTPPGKMIDIGGARVHLNCMGTGPIIVMILGAGYSFDWSLVQPEAAKFTRVCTYDPPGSVWSDPKPSPTPSPTCDGWIGDIHSMLQHAGTSGPLVLVGHSIGATLARLYTARFPDSVQGLVLSDYAGAYRMTNADAVIRADGGSLQRLPPLAQAMHRWAESRGGVPAQMAVPKVFFECIAEAAKTTIYLGNKPVVVVSDPYIAESEDYRRVQADLLALSQNSKAMIAPHSGHGIPMEDPGVLIGAIGKVIYAAQTKSALR
jgi:pimeloyl-ACP methyl ester carboxylesterase